MKAINVILEIDPEAEIERISNFIREKTRFLRREGAVIGLSGGVDSAVSAEFCVRALGKEKVLGLILPEKESNPVSKDYAIKQAQKMGIAVELIDITAVLEAFGTYARRDPIIKPLFPGYNEHCKIKIVLPGDILSRDTLNFFTLLIDDEKGEVHSFRLKKEALNTIVAATNTKQRTRMMHLYYFAEKMNFLVCGTTNRTEMVQGYFVKYGDGGVDIEPIAHLYKTQVFELARHLGVIEEILKRIPSPDTFSFPVSDEEFFFRLPYDRLDVLLYCWEKRLPVEKVCEITALGAEQVRRAFRDFSSKFKRSQHLRQLPASIQLP